MGCVCVDGWMALGGSLWHEGVREKRGQRLPGTRVALMPGRGQCSAGTDRGKESNKCWLGALRLPQEAGRFLHSGSE